MTTKSEAKIPSVVPHEAVLGGDTACALLALAELTNDTTYLRDWGQYIHGPDDSQHDFPKDVADDIKAALLSVVDTQSVQNVPDEKLIRTILPHAAGGSLPENSETYLLQEMGLSETANVTWKQDVPEAVKDFNVVIIGAGLSGILVAKRLHDLGIDFEVYEALDGCGGSWRTATYPGASPDSAPSQFFSYSFAPNPRWTNYYASQDEIVGYLGDVITRQGMSGRFHYNHKVASVDWINDANKWDVTIQNASGNIKKIHANVVVSAVGLLAESLIPDFPGLETFSGEQLDAGAWDSTIDIANKRVALIGSGATANIIGPRLAADAGALKVFQRNPHWITNVEKYGQHVPEAEKWLLENIPSYARWRRVRDLLNTTDYYRDVQTIDPEWHSANQTFSAANEAYRSQLIQYITDELGEHRPDLIPKMIPSYPPFSRRIIRDSGWYRMFLQDNVEFYQAANIRFDETGIFDDDGCHHEVDLVVFATGYKVQTMLSSLEVTGATSQKIRDVWGEDNARAFLGLTVPDFPNFFLMFGPNVAMAAGGSTISTAEMWSRYIVSAIVRMIEDDIAAVAVKPDVYAKYNEKVDSRLSEMGWASSAYPNWYQNAAGRVTTHMPWTNYEYWHLTREFDDDDYILRRKS